MLADQRAAPAPLIRESGAAAPIDTVSHGRSSIRTTPDLLLSDPTTILGEHDCPPQEYLSLRSINASNLLEFAEQAQALFWGSARAWRASGALLADDDVGQLAWHDDNPLHRGPGRCAA